MRGVTVLLNLRLGSILERSDLSKGLQKPVLRFIFLVLAGLLSWVGS